MADDFKIVVITPPTPVDNESVMIERLLGAGADIVSLRKPAIGERYIESVLQNIRPELRKRIRLHDYPHLARAFNTGFQLNSRIANAEGISPSMLSKSCHSLAEAAEARDVDYVTLSPIFDSVSKPGYNSRFDISNIDLSSIKAKTIALGGVTLDRLPLLRKAGFDGAAMLGDVWRNRESFDSFIRYLAMRNSRLQYITDGATPDETVNLALEALKGGCRWVQIRMKDVPVEAVTDVATELAPKFTEQGATLIVDDHIEIAANIDGLAGVHLGQTDLSPAEARKILPPHSIIGFTVNTTDQLKTASATHRPHIDYLGIGPLRFTSTKKKLAPTLGFDGLDKMRTKMKELDFVPPAVIVGGVTADDFEQISNIGFGGIAVSGAIGKSSSPFQATTKLIQRAANTFRYKNEDDFIRFKH